MSLYSFKPPLSLLHPPLNFIQAVFCLWASCRLSSRFPSSFLWGCFEHSFELPSSLPSASFRLNLNFLWLSLRFPWALPQNYLNLAWNFLQACFMFPSGFFQAPCKLPRVSIAISRNLLQTCFQLASCSLQAAFELLWSLLGACFGHSSNWEAQNLKTLVLCLACTGFWSSKP